MTQTTTGVSAAIREFVAKEYAAKARREGSSRFTVNAGEVHRAMHLQNRVPQVCSVLQSAKFLRENGLRIAEKSGPPSGFSTSVTVKYEFIDQPAKMGDDEFLALRGIARDVFAALGGGEQFIRSEREAWSAKDDEK
jgi:hypothetical protein